MTEYYFTAKICFNISLINGICYYLAFGRTTNTDKIYKMYHRRAGIIG